jgi:diguanylate cyclase (GGDEF)-like protein/PAS domain S-box-containing protein
MEGCMIDQNEWHLLCNQVPVAVSLSSEGDGLCADVNARLNQQLRLFESMESLASVGYWTSGDDPGSLIWSKGMYQLAGLAPGSIQNRTDGRRRIHVDDLSAFALARHTLDGQTLEYRWLHPDGRVHWHRTCMQRLTDGHPGESDLAFGMVQDITHERETALALRDKLGFIQKITSRLPGVVFQMRRNAQGVHEFLYISEPASQIYPGFTAQDILQDAYCTLSLHHPDDLVAFTASVRQALSQLEAWHHEYRLRLPNGEVRWLLGHGMPEADANGAVLMSGFVTDITERKHSEERLRRSEARFRALTELSSDWYWEQNERFQFVQVTGNLDAMNVLPSTHYTGKTRWDSGAQGVSPSLWDSHRAALAAHEVFHDFEMQRVRSDGTLMWASISGAPMFDAGGKFVGYQGIGRDITARKLAEEKFEQLAFYDALTGLPNRRLLIERLQLALLGTGRHDLYSAVLFIDLDNFKDLNDTHGHDMGDMLLHQVASRLQGSVREVDTVARLGGDEFVVVLQELGSDVEAVTARVEQVGRKILTKLNQLYVLGNLEHHSTPSIGVALLSRQVTSVDELLKRADLAMYESKAAGRNTMRFFDPAMQALVAQRSAIDRDLRLALKRNELVLYYQPVVDSQAMVVGVEALVRWQHPRLGFLPPSEFISQAEHTGLIVPLGQWVLRTACEQLVQWAGKPETARLTMAVNVSARQFRHPDFVAQVLKVLSRTGADARLLKLEITESLLVTDMQDVVEKMQALRAALVSFSLDDFGTGYSSLSYLKRLPLDQLKIDQSFVRDVLTDPSDAAIANTVLALGQSLNLRVVAEGVEELGQCEFLLRNGCTFFQGYLFGKPVPINQLRLGCLAPPG